jgi:nicotinamide-nucleotide amidase
MVEHSVLPRIQALLPDGERKVLKIWRVVGVPESIVEAGVGEELLGLGLELGYCARLGEVDVRIWGSPPQAEEAERILRNAFGKAVLDSGAASIEQWVVEELSRRKQTVSTAESCTGGFIANLLTHVPGSSVVFDSGRVTYANWAKVELGVPEELLETHGAVSEPVAAALAGAARAAGRATYGIATTGIAGPAGGSEDKPVGTVFVAVAGPEGTIRVEKHAFRTDRLAFKQLAAQAALLLLRRVLLEIPAD